MGARQRAGAADLRLADQPQHRSKAARDGARVVDEPAVRARLGGRDDRLDPYAGIDRWFEPGRELVVVASADEAVATYRELLEDPAAAEELGRRARERVLDEHTYAHRARRLLELVGVEAVARV